MRLKQLLDHDTILPLRLRVDPLNLDWRRFRLTITGITSLTNNPDSSRSPTSPAVALPVEVPLGYPESRIPDIRFESPIPFHPHIWPDGRICWGTQDRPQFDLTLADWVRGVIEYLQYSQGEGSLFHIDSTSPANAQALAWWQRNRSRINRYVTPIDMARLRFWINQSRG